MRKMLALGTPRILSARKAAVSLIFATVLIPMLMIVGLAIDYGLYNEARSQLEMAADASVLQAARIGAQLLQQSNTQAQARQKAIYAGQQWFLSQLGTVPQAYSKSFSPTVAVTITTNQVTATINYNGVITAHFGSLFPGHWLAYPNWNIGGTATAVVSIPSYVEVMMLLDNSSSMLIAAYPDGITAMDNLTPCSKQAINNDGQSFDYNYSWAYTPVGNTYQTNPPASAYSTTRAPNAYIAPGAKATTIMLPYGYGTFIYPSTTGATITHQELPPPVSPVGQCDARFTGATDGIPCNYPGPGTVANVAAPTSTTAGLCTNGGGNAGSLVNYQNTPTPAGQKGVANTPQAPCAFACHTDAGGNDYYGLARANNVTLRFDVVQSAAEQVIQAINSPSNPAGQIAMGIFDFNAPMASQNGNPALVGFTDDYPGNNVEASYNLTNASDALAKLQSPITPDQADSDIPGALAALTAIIRKTSGTGATKTNAKKNLFIVTDGMADYYAACGSAMCRVQGPIDPVASCKPIKDLGITIYVLYTLYQPLPNPFYLGSDAQYAESATGGEPPIRAALRQCASSTADFYEADQTNQIQPALLAMLASALGSPDRLEN